MWPYLWHIWQKQKNTKTFIFMYIYKRGIYQQKREKVHSFQMDAEYKHMASYNQSVYDLKAQVLGYVYRKHTLISLFSGFITTFSFPATQMRAIITVLGLFYSSHSENS
jgi:hypothetical protein